MQRMTSMDKKRLRRALTRNNDVLPDRLTSVKLYEPGGKTFTPRGTANGMLKIYRTKRRVTAEQKQQCKNLAISSRISGGVSKIAEAAAVSVGLFFGPIGSVIVAGVQGVFELATMATDVASLALDCASLPFEDLKDKMDDKFNELDKAVDRNYQLLREVSKIAKKTLLTAEMTRTEMHEGFDSILTAVEELAIGPEIAKMNGFINYFNEKQRFINKFARMDYYGRIEEINDILENLRELKTSGGDSLTTINKIIDRNLANPKDSNDLNKLAALNALYYGIQTYYSVLFFLIEQHSTIASNYYRNGDLDNYNKHFIKISDIFDHFKEALTGPKSLIDKVVERLEAFESNKLISTDQKRELLSKIKELNEKKSKLYNMKLPFIIVNPKTLPGKPIVNSTRCDNPIRDKDLGTKVSYAIQYKNGDHYSRVGEWSEPITLDAEEIPNLIIPVDQEGQTRIIFRKFLGKEPEVVGVIEDVRQREFRDINRDLYNAALGNRTERFNILISNGADPKVVFDEGRSAIHAAAEGGSTKIIEKLVTIDSGDINSRDSNGYTPLHVAAEAGYGEFLETLIRHGADINARTNIDELTPLHLAINAGYSHTVEYLLTNKKININLGDRDGFTPLHFAIKSSPEFVRILVKHKGVHVNAKSNTNLTPLHLAAIYSNTEAAQELLKDPKVKVNTQSDGKLTALHYAIISGNVKMVKLLRKKKANLNATAEKEMTPLHFSVSLKRVDITKELLKGPIDVNSKDKDSATPLHIAAGNEDGEEMAIELLKKNANVDDATKDGLTPLHIAAMRKNKQMVIILTNGNSNIEARTNDGTTPLLAACQKQAFDIVKYLIEERQADVMAKDDSGNDLLQMSIKSGQLDMVQYIINNKNFNGNLSKVLLSTLPYSSLNIVQYLVEEKNVDASCTDLDNYCPLSEACKYNYLPVVEYLAKKAIGVKFGEAPLQNALQYGNLDIVRYFVDKKDALDNYTGPPPLLIAAKYGQYSVVKYLYEVRKIRMEESEDDQKRSPLLYAAASGNLDVIKYLIEDCKVDVNTKDSNGNSVLHYAIDSIKENNLNDETVSTILKYFVVKAKVDVNTRNSNRKTPLDRAVQHDLRHAVELLISLGAQVVITTGMQATNVEMQEFLEMQSACNDIATKHDQDGFFHIVFGEAEFNKPCLDITKPDIYHSTALHLAINTGAAGLAQTIIKRSPDLNMKDELGNTPLHVAVERANADLIKQLIKYGADVSIKNLKGYTPKRFAKQNNLLKIVHLLDQEQLKLRLWSIVKKDDDVTDLSRFDKLKEDLCEQNKNGNTLVHLAAKKGHINILNYLISKKCPVNSVNKYGRTPLYMAASQGQVGIVQVLLDNGADISTTNYPAEDVLRLTRNDVVGPEAQELDENGGNEAMIVCPSFKYENFDVVKMFVEERNAYSKNPSDTDNVLKSVKEGDMEALRQIVEEKGVDVNSLYHGLPLLADACLAGQLEMVQYLMEKGAGSGVKGVFGCTPLHWAVFGGHLDVVKQLVQESEIDLNAVDAGGRTPLQYSAMYGNADIVKYFIDTQGLDMNLKDYKGNSIAHLAAQGNNLDTLTYLIDNKEFSFEAKNNFGSTPLHVAAEHGHLKIVELLIKKGAQTEEPDNRGRTPLFVATEHRYKKLIKNFIANGARVDTTDKDGQGLRAIPIIRGDLALDKYLEDQGASDAELDPSIESMKHCHLTPSGARHFHPGKFLLPSESSVQKRSAGNQSSIEFRGTSCLQNNLSLGLLLLQNFFDKSYPLPKFTEMTPEIVRATALEMIDDLKKVVRKSAPNAEAILDKLDFYQLYLDIEANIKNETVSNIPKTLLTFINSGCSDDSQVVNSIIGEIGKMFPQLKLQ